MDGIDGGSDKPGGPERPRPEDSAEAILRLHNNLLSVNLARAIDASARLDELFPPDTIHKRSDAERQRQWMIIESLMHQTEQTTADRFMKIAVVALREVLYKTPPPTPDEVIAHLVARLEEEVAQLTLEPKKP